MKILFYLSLIFILLSCQEIINCSVKKTDLAEKWTALPTEKISFLPSIARNVIEFEVEEIVRLGLPNDCRTTYETRSIFEQDTITNTYLRGITYEIIATENDVKIYYSFFPASPAIVGTSSPQFQKLGCISVLQESRCTNERNEIGNVTINGILHREVIELKENKSRPNQKEIKQILANKKGILRIEFYDGEIWNRIF